tara:strand:+ start:97 stop:324 length:228 start_codon:yes stop_codon:yes gene_type:complete
VFPGHAAKSFGWEMGHGVCSGSGNGKGKLLEELPGWDLKCILKFYLSDLVVGNGNGRPVRCCLASRVIVKVTTRR